MHHRNSNARRDLGDAADISGRNQIRRNLLDMRDFAVPQPDAVVRMASTPSPSISFIHTAILRRAAACAAVSSPMWWASDPQHPSPVAITTSNPWRLRTRIADALISGASALATHPDN